ncbi:hypothetical protein SS50377_25141 [Spironucleus salmonicida]|uniref:Uncharacterized protein n=1 Tax=Spironucleus salmonicida TaxID=348837 RepID=A0A9P8LRS0_9EUKA|nr:hypothetical protein SS50377_25141 [Spironucleus salmonicida]
MGGRVSKITEQADVDMDTLVKIHSQQNFQHADVHQVMSLPNNLNEYGNNNIVKSVQSHINLFDKNSIELIKLLSVNQLADLIESSSSIVFEQENSVQEQIQL